jgi:hypothetical protein
VATSRRQLRRWIAGEFGELITGTATDDGSLSQFIDAVTFAVPDSELQGREVWYVSSADGTSTANVGTLRYVDDNNGSDASISVVPDWPAIPKTGDVVELYNARGYSVSTTEIHEKIEQLVTEVAEEGALSTTSSDLTLAWNNPYLVVPDDWIWLFGAQFQDYWGNWNMVHPADIEPQTWTDPVTVKITGPSVQAAWAASSLLTPTIRLIGAAPLTPPTRDTDTTTVDASWLVKQAAAELMIAAAMRWGDAATAIALHNNELAKAQEKRPKADGVYPRTGRRWRVRP